MRRISLKNEIGNILESSTYLKEDRNEWGGGGEYIYLSSGS